MPYDCIYLCSAPSEALRPLQNLLSEEEAQLMVIVRQILGFRDGLITAQAGDSRIDVAGLQQAMNELINEAGENQVSAHH